jgi:cation transport regulator ChaB
MNKVFLISATICIAAVYGAYSEHMKDDPREQAIKDRVSSENIAHDVAIEAMKEQYRCLAEDPSNFCNRDLSYQDHLKGSRELAKKYDLSGGISDHAKNRNLLILIAFLFGWIAKVTRT